MEGHNWIENVETEKTQVEFHMMVIKATTQRARARGNYSVSLGSACVPSPLCPQWWTSAVLYPAAYAGLSQRCFESDGPVRTQDLAAPPRGTIAYVQRFYVTV